MAETILNAAYQRKRFAELIQDRLDNLRVVTLIARADIICFARATLFECQKDGAAMIFNIYPSP